ncbi:MAG: hypothetical protein DRO13_03420, partial [Thermoprotei archaeon]
MGLGMLRILLGGLALKGIPRVEEIYDTFKNSGLDYEVLGSGWCGSPIYLFKAGKGSKKILLIDMVDPDEPVGVLALQLLVTKVFDYEPALLVRYSWYLIPVADPCGAQLNEEWFREPYNIKLYLLRRFKIKVVEWKLPGTCNGYVFDKPTQEALAVKKAIDMIEPDLVVPLHNNDFGGLYFFLSKYIPKLVRELKTVAKELGLPLHRGMPEASYLEVFEDGFYREPTMCDEYYNCIKHGIDPRACTEGLGETIYGYAKRVNPRVFSITCETPYIYSKVLEDSTPSGTTLKHLYLNLISMVEPVAHQVESTVKKMIPYIDERCPYLWEVKEYILGWSNRLRSLKKRVDTSEEYEREASKAEEFDVIVVRGLWNTLLKLGIVLRFLSKCVRRNGDVDIREVITDLTNIFEEFYSKL